jgi:MSHA biogenesis protein MshK
MKKLSVALSLLTLLPLWSPLTEGAELLADPTRPPEANFASGPVESKSDSLVLQSVILGKGRNSAAIISGQVVQINGKIGDARLIRLTESQAVLKGPEGETTLHLTPAVDKRVTQSETKNSKPAPPAVGSGRPDTKESAGQK